MLLKEKHAKKVVKPYRLGYDYLFLAEQSFSYKEEFIGAMSVNVIFKIFDGKGNEILFESDELKDQGLYLKNGKEYYLFELILCSIDKTERLKFQPNFDLITNMNYTLQFEIVSYTKDIDKGFLLDPMEISKEEFMDILDNNIFRFDIIDNHPAQTTTFFTQEQTL